MTYRTNLYPLIMVLFLAGNRRYYSAAKNMYICTNVLVSILYDKYMQYVHMYIKSSCEVVNGHYVWHFTTLYVIQILRTFLQLPFTLGKKKVSNSKAVR